MILTIDTSGNVGIGDTSPGTKLSIISADNAAGIKMAMTNATFTNQSLLIDNTRTASTAYNFGLFRSNLTGTPDNEFIFRGDGTGYSDLGWTTPAADYAEYFESSTGAKIPFGKCVVISFNNNNKISIIREYDETIDNLNDIIGVVRPKVNCKGAFIGNSHQEQWREKYLTNVWGEFIMVDYEVYEWIDEDGKEHSYNSWDIPDDVIKPVWN